MQVRGRPGESEWQPRQGEAGELAEAKLGFVNQSRWTAGRLAGGQAVCGEEQG